MVQSAITMAGSAGICRLGMLRSLDPYHKYIKWSYRSIEEICILRRNPPHTTKKLLSTMLFPVQLVTMNLKNEEGQHCYQPGNVSADPKGSANQTPKRPQLQRRQSSSSSMRSWSSKSSFGRRMVDFWDGMPVYNSNMQDPVFFTRRDGGSLRSSRRSSPLSSRATSMVAVPTVNTLVE